MITRSRLVVFTIFTLFQYAWGDCPSERMKANHYEAKLHGDLFCAYHNKYRPVKDHRSAVNVTIRFSLKYLSFDTFEETITVHSWMTMTWKDEFLTWDPNNYANISELQVESYKLWSPQLALYNANVAIHQLGLLETISLLQNSGIVTSIAHIPHNGICRTSLSRWPYDSQNCTLYFGSWMHTGEQVNFKFFNSSPLLMDSFENGPGWKLIKVYNERLHFYKCCPNATYPMLKYTFSLKRESAGIAAIVVIPSLLIITMTIVSLLLDVKNNRRLAFQIFALYTHFLLITQIGYMIPKHSEDTPVLILLIRDSIIITFASILLTLLLKCLLKRTQQVPPWLIALNNLVKSSPARYAVFSEFEMSVDEYKLNDSGNQSGSDWLSLASFLNSIVSIIFIIAYLILLSIYIPIDTKTVT